MIATVAVGGGWAKGGDGEARFCIDRYLEERAEWVAWRGIRIHNWHRPLSRYMSLLLGQGLNLRHFSEPIPSVGHPKGSDPCLNRCTF